LRRAVGQNTILYEDEYYQLNPTIDREYDVEAFEAYAARARSSTRPEEQISFYQQAIDLVGGRYLVDVDALWVAPERERLHQVFVSAALALADLYLREGHSNRVLEICQRILEQEATSEAAYRLKMHAHSRQGDTAALIRAYRECEDSLRGVFGMPPSAETQELYRKLVS
jgi:DNA-binding SARP family transcriptional activator